MGVSNAWGKTIYLYTNGIGWPDNSAKIWVHAWGSGKVTDVQMTKIKDKLYKADISDADTQVIFTRTESASTGVWDKEWNRVGEQSLNDETPCLKLTDWTTGTWGKISYDAHIYLDNSVANWSEATKEFIIGHSSYSNTYTMTNISNTKLYYLAFSDIWHGYWDYGFIGVTSHWGEYKDNDITNRIKDATKRTGTRGDQVINGTKLFVPENANNDAVLTKTDLSGYSALNYTQTIKSAVKLAGQNYAEANAKAAITVTSYNLTDNGVISSQNSASISTSSQSTTISAARTATTTLTVGDVATGYQFDGWYTAATDGTQLSTSTTYTYYPTEAKTVYARFSEITYPVQLESADINQGTVSPANVNAGQFTGVTITATPNLGYQFVNWTATDGITITNANDASTTIKATQEGSVTANFVKIDYKTIYLKPGAWSSSNARFAVYAFGNGEEWYNMEQSDCNNEHYQCDINGKYTTVVICRMNPSTNDNNFNNEVRWNQTENLTISTEGMCFYDRTKIYLKPNANWKTYGARFAAYFYLASNQEQYKWMSMLDTNEEGVFYCNYPTEHAYDRVIFCRMNGAEKENIWGNRLNQTDNIDLFKGGNIYTINEGEWGSDGKGAKGSWSYEWKVPTYPLTLKATPYGEYTVKCNGVSHTSSRTKDIVIDLPVGATVEITQAESYDAAYSNDLVIKTSSNSQYKAAELNNTYTFCGATTIEENFTTTAGHVVFLRVADAHQWNTSGNNYIYCTNRLTNEVVTMTAVAAGNSEINQETGYNYFKATIPAGYRAFRFERKTELSAVATNTTAYFEHLLPLGQSNCFTIAGKNTQLNKFYGDWTLGTADGDYRILYVEQQVAHDTGENAWRTVINTTYQHSSDIIKKGDGATIVSLHIDYDANQHPAVILQKFTNGEWVDVEGQAHMVLGPLTASAGMAMLPGRRNAEGDVNLLYSNGIEKIKTDAASGIAGRVWNFVVQQSGPSAYIDFTANDFKPYEGKYYIRTDNAAGGWMTYAIPSNVMSHSDYSLQHSGYSHYFCKWVALNGTPNVKFVVANDYGAAISETIASDIYTDGEGTLTAAANVRWMWNEYTNIGSRAYIAGSNVDDFLVAKYAASSNQKFADKGDWVYEADLTDVHINDKLTSIAAKYGEKPLEELLEKSHVDAGGLVMLASAGNNAGESSYTVRIMYDFKINQTICYLIPTGTAVATSIDVLIERTNQDEEGNATQVTAAINPANSEVGLTVYGLITLTKDHITDPNKSEQEALTYWISFPFDVKIGDITGFGKVGQHWMIKYYDGAERAAKGWFLDTKTFWKFFLDTDDVMQANTGYVLTLNKSLLNASNPVYDNTATLRLYFPSKEKIKKEINSGLTTTTVDVPAHWCNITSPADRTIKDSHWNMIGVPSYANKTITTTNETIKYFYDYSHQDDRYNTTQNAGAKTFKPMHAYMVQFAGVIDWHNQAFNEAQQQLAAKKNTDAEEQYTLRLELQQNGTRADQTFVELHDDATTMFDMNVDLTKMFNASSANIYTLIGSNNQVAANVMPIANTTIPVGVQIAKAGEYTFAMPDGTDGITVELIDYNTNTHTNLLLSDYTVNLPAGTCETRFALSVKIDKTATSVENITEVEGANGEGVKKYIIDGKLFLQKDNTLYDAQGHIVR